MRSFSPATHQIRQTVPRDERADPFPGFAGLIDLICSFDGSPAIRTVGILSASRGLRPFAVHVFLQTRPVNPCPVYVSVCLCAGLVFLWIVCPTLKLRPSGETATVNNT